MQIAISIISEKKDDLSHHYNNLSTFPSNFDKNLYNKNII